MEVYTAIGIMSGTSMDGVDLACCRFWLKKERWYFTIDAAQTIPYSTEWVKLLNHLFHEDGNKLTKTDYEFGLYLGHLVKQFMHEHNLKPDFIASHGHTIFHQPDQGYTLQIGNGNSIAAVTDLPIIYDFRSLDVALGGQGAPLVPIGDQLLFPSFDFCLNLGGFANISFELNGKRQAYDICPVNIVLNHLSQQIGLNFDPQGENAAKGQINQKMLDQLNGLDYYQKPFPKSLGREWVEDKVHPILNNSYIPVENKLATFSKHVAHQIGKALLKKPKGRLMVTGGGALNSFLVNLLKEHTELEVHIPDEELIHYKEAMIFAFLGTLRWTNKINCLSSVTGASRDSSSGIIVRG
ncbi:MAG: anhydro-N-acetylmuramic acid kinase [Bacteroidetes bacterium]|nr:anhydro-N-acetylmuramic acid kinase [Bacteroidota bacterium]